MYSHAGSDPHRGIEADFEAAIRNLSEEGRNETEYTYST